MTNDEAVALINERCIYPDFPISGIKFVDIFPLLERESLILQLSPVRDDLEGIILVPEARGFIFYEALKQPNTAIVPLRKKGKMPGNLIEIPIQKEYGVDTLYLQVDALLRAASKLADRYPDGVIPVVFFDDLLATGGTAMGVLDKISNFAMDVPEGKFYAGPWKAVFYMELDALKGRDYLDLANIQVSSVYHY